MGLNQTTHLHIPMIGTHRQIRPLPTPLHHTYIIIHRPKSHNLVTYCWKYSTDTHKSLIPLPECSATTNPPDSGRNHPAAPRHQAPCEESWGPCTAPSAAGSQPRLQSSRRIHPAQRGSSSRAATRATGDRSYTGRCSCSTICRQRGSCQVGDLVGGGGCSPRWHRLAPSRAGTGLSVRLK